MANPADVVVKDAVKTTRMAVVPPESPAAVVAAKPRVVAAKPLVTAAIAKKPSRPSGRYLLQLSAVPSARSARREVARLEKLLARLLGKRRIVIVKAARPGKPPVYRLRASAYDSRAAARTACNQKENGLPRGPALTPFRAWGTAVLSADRVYRGAARSRG